MSNLLFTESTELNPALMGRESQVECLRNRMEDALNGRGSVVTVAGATGMGKTRLMTHVERQAEAREMLFLYGAGDPIRSRTPYGLLIGVLEDLLQHASRGGRDALQGAVESLAPHLVGTLFSPDQSREKPSLPDLVPDLRQTLFLARLANSLLELARHRPVLVCLENLHWADSASLQALRYLATRNEDAPLMLVATYRPEELRETAEEGSAVDPQEILQEIGSNPHFHELTLDELSATETRALVNSCFPRSGFGDELLDGMYRRTGGIPLFVVQYLDFLRDEGAIFQRRGLWMDRSIRQPEGPESIQATVQKRIKKLSAEERHILIYAAPQGETFDSQLVAWALGWPHTKVQCVLEELEHTHRMVQSYKGKYRFTHITIANAFIAQLPEEFRRSAHLRLASCLEQHRPADVELLAHHFYSGADLARALPYLKEAGKRANDVDAFWEAHGLFNQALEALEREDGPEKQVQRLEILLTVAEIDELLGELERSEELCREVLAVASPETNRTVVGRAWMDLGWLHYRKGEWEQAEKLYRDALEIFTDVDDAEKSAKLHMRLGNIAFEHSRLDEATSYFDSARDTALQSGNQAMLGGIYGNLGVLSSVRGHYEDAVGHYAQALQAYSRVNHSYGAAQIEHNLGMTYAARQAWEKALTCYAGGEKLAREMGTVDVLANILVSQATAQVGLGDLDAAETSCRSAEIYYTPMQDPLGLAECDKVRGIICRERTQYVRAEELLQQSRKCFCEFENLLGVAECDQELGLVRQYSGDVEGAQAYFRDSIERFEEIGALEEARKAKALIAALTP